MWHVHLIDLMMLVSTSPFQSFPMGEAAVELAMVMSHTEFAPLLGCQWTSQLTIIKVIDRLMGTGGLPDLTSIAM